MILRAVRPTAGRGSNRCVYWMQSLLLEEPLWSLSTLALAECWSEHNPLARVGGFSALPQAAPELFLHRHVFHIFAEILARVMPQCSRHVFYREFIHQFVSFFLVWMLDVCLSGTLISTPPERSQVLCNTMMLNATRSLLVTAEYSTILYLPTDNGWYNS